MPVSPLTKRSCRSYDDSSGNNKETVIISVRQQKSSAPLATQAFCVIKPHRKIINMKMKTQHHRSLIKKLLFFLLFTSTFLFLLSTLPAVVESTSQTAAGPMPDHVRVVVIVDNSTSSVSYAAKQASFLESAAKLYSFMDKSLVLDQTRLIVSLIRLPARDVLTSTKLLCKELQSTSNLIALIVGDVGTALMNFIVGLANDAEIPLIDLTVDFGRFMVSPTRYGPSRLVTSPIEAGFVVYFRPSSALHLTTAVEDMMGVYKWDRMLMLYDKPESLTQMQKILGDVGIDGVPSEKAVFRLNNSNLFEVTQSIKYRWPNVIVALDEAMTVKFLRVALRTGILSQGYSYILTNPNAHFISMEDFAQNYPNVTLLRFIVDNEITRNILENARRFEEIQSNKYRVLVPDDSIDKGDDIPKILVYNRELPMTLSAALLLDALTLVRRALASVFSPEPWSLGPTTTSTTKTTNPFIFKQTSGIACRSIQPRANVPQQSPVGKTVLKALVSAAASFEGITGTVAFNPRTNFRDVCYLEILGLGGIGLQRIGTWRSDAAVLRETAIERIAEQLKQDQKQETTTSGLPPVPSKILSPRELRLHLDQEAIYMLKRATVLTNRTLVSTTIKKKTLLVTTVLEEPYVMIRKDKSKHSPNSRSAIEHNFEGYCVDLLDEIAAMTGFTYRLHIVGDGAYGSLNRKTGRWTGMIGEVIEGKADIAVAPLTITYAREQVVDFTKPFLNLGISILYLQPFKEKPSVFSFMQPLAGEIWGYVMLSYLVVTFIFYAVGRFSPYEWHSTGFDPTPTHGDEDTPPRFRNPLDIQHHVNVFTLANSSWFTAGTLMQQGSDVNPRALSTRIVGGAWWFFSLIIISSYTANLAAFLTVETVYSPFESADELAKQTKVQYGAVKGGSTENFFRESKIDTYRTMWGAMQNKDVFVKNNTEGISRVRAAAGGYAYLMESVSLEYIIQSPTLNKDCDLRQVGGLLDSKGYGIATARESPYRDVLSMAILQLQENDRLQLLYNKWWKSSGTCVREETKPKVLGTQNIGGIFAILLIGLAFSLISLAAEVLWYARQQNPDDTRPYWRRLLDNFRLITTFKSKLRQELRDGPRRRRSSRRSASNRSASAVSTNAQDSLTIQAPEVFLPLAIKQSSPLVNKNKNRRSRSFHGGEKTTESSDPYENIIITGKEVKDILRRHRASDEQYRMPAPLNLPSHSLHLVEDVEDEMSEQFLRSGNKLSSRTPTNALSLLEDLAEQHRRQQQEERDELLDAVNNNRRRKSIKPRSSLRQQQQQQDGNERFPVVSFETNVTGENNNSGNNSSRQNSVRHHQHHHHHRLNNSQQQLRPSHDNDGDEV